MAAPIASLFTATSLGDLQLKNRIVHPAMTRARCPTRVPNRENVRYYAQRASAGMIIGEATAVSFSSNGFVDSPGMYSEEHVHGWSAVTKAVHDEGGTIVCQLWHTGRMSHSSFRGGAAPVAPSAIPMPAEVNGVPSLGVQVGRVIERRTPFCAVANPAPTLPWPHPLSPSGSATIAGLRLPVV